ncbi:MAG: chromosome segregation protein SMC [bacterium]
MRIQGLRIAGFKSFCHPTSFTFQHNGVTIVVGPNGCGKSNVVDSIRWVLGEQRAKQLRGGSMEDVIFAGSAYQKPLGMAEVTLTFTNPAGDTLPKYREYSEIEITRRLYRSGESQYLINKTPVRLLDIRELFMDTGVGGGTGYSIIQQGKIEEMINARPEERRNFIDDAAGIVKFRLKRQSAEKRLDETRQNLLRVDDVLQELERQEEGLKDQVEQARLYLKLREDIRKAEYQLILYRWNQAKQREEDAKSRIAITEATQTEEQLTKQTRVTELETLGLEITLSGEKLAATRNEMFLVDKELQDAESQRQLISQGIQNAEERIQQLIEDNQQLEEAQNELKLEASEDQLEMESLQKNYQLFAEALQKLESDRLQENEALASQNNLLRDLQQSLLQTHTKLTNATNQQNFVIERLEQQQTRLVELREQHIQAQHHVQEAQQKLSRSSGRTSVLEEEQEQLDEELKDLRLEHDEQQEVLEERRNQLKSLLSEFQKLQSRLNSLREIQERYEDFSDSVQQLLRYFQQHPAEKEKIGFLGIFADFAILNTDNPKILAPILENILDWVILTSIQDIPKLEKLCQEQNFSRLEVLTLDRLPPLSEISSSTSITDKLIQCKPPLQEWGNRWFQQITFVEENEPIFEEALDKWQSNTGSRAWVSAAGTYLPAFGGIRCGRPAKASFGFLQRQQEIELLQNKSRVEEDRIQALEEGLESLEEESQERELEIQDLRDRLHEIQLDLTRLQQEKEHNQREVFRTEESLKMIEQDGLRLKTEQERLENQKQEIQLEFTHQEERRQQLENEVAAQQQQIQIQQQSLQEVSEEHTRLRLQIAESTEQIRNIKGNLERNQRNQSEIESRRQRILEALELANSKSQEGQLRIKELDTLMPTLLKKRLGLDEKIKIDTKTYEQQNQLQGDLTKRLQEVQKVLENLLQQIHQQRIEQTEHRLQREQLEEQLSDQWDFDPESNLSESLAEINEASLVNGLRKQRQQLEAIGNVNLAAPAEYDLLMERLEFLQSQSSDLTQAAEDLERTIREINIESRRRFKEMFEKVNNQFGTLFSQLFGGGEARMVLTESEDVLESGVEIFAQPPGKKLQNLNLLSGGEKALTAISLVFAIFLIKPSPFCVLDEVDAPLDDANVVRFNQLIRRLTTNSQFVVITHNKKTMEIGDALYGVTMDEPGVSKTVSVRFEEADRLSA